MKNFIKPGDVVTFTATAAIAGGELVLLGAAKLPAVNTYSVKTGESGEACTVGVYELPKASADTPAEFAKAYWSTNNEVTTVATGNTLIGTFYKAAANGETTCQVRLSGVSA